MSTRRIVWGTSHFFSMHSAYVYYLPYYHGDSRTALAAVQDKVRQGEIHIGKPLWQLKPGDEIVLIDRGTRYGIRTPH